MYDVLIRGAEIYDGTGGKPFTADVAVRNGCIASVGGPEPKPAKQVIDARGKCLLPGFIDAHTHSDVVTLTHHSREEALRQGITTEVLGSCGIGVVPMSRGREDYVRSVRAITGDPGNMGDIHSVDTYFNNVGNAATNYALQLAHCPVRIEAVGNRDTPIGKPEMAAMEAVAHKAFEEGACAFSTGLAYFPCAFSDTEEVVRLCCVAREHGVPFTIHQRSVVNRHFPNGIDPLGEAFEIARKSGVHLHLSHYKTRKFNVGNVEEVVRPIEEALQEGLHVTADFYPYPAGCGYIAVFLPAWVMDGSTEDALSRMADPKLRDRILADMEKDPKKLADGTFSHAPKHPDYLGRTFVEVARSNGQRVSEMLLQFLLEEELDGGYIPDMDFSEEMLARFRSDYARLIQKPYYMLGSDTLPLQQRPHPRTLDTFPKMLRVAREHAVPLETLANRLSSAPAEVFGLENRGVIRPGFHADLLLFNKEEGFIADRPETVLVNGVCKLSGNVLAPELSGQGLRHRSYYENRK